MTASIFVIILSSPVLRASRDGRVKKLRQLWASLDADVFSYYPSSTGLTEMQSLNFVLVLPEATDFPESGPPHSIVRRHPHGNRNYLSCLSGFVIEGWRRELA